MSIQRTSVENLSDAFVIVKQRTNAGFELGGGYRPLARKALAEIIEHELYRAVDHDLDGINTALAGAATEADWLDQASEILSTLLFILLQISSHFRWLVYSPPPWQGKSKRRGGAASRQGSKQEARSAVGATGK